MRPSDAVILKTLEIADRMNEIADEGDRTREDSGCGVLYGVLRDSAYKIRRLAEEEREVHLRRGRKDQGIGVGKRSVEDSEGIDGPC